jgi:hydroxymethylpyrimidine/phosphomethylpyrimidine kinase
VTLPRTPVALSVAGSDSSAGAGIQADLKTFSAFGVYGATAITAITAQNTTGVTAVHAVPPEVVAAQIEAVARDLAVAAVKTGMVGTAEVILAVCASLKQWLPNVPLVIDPVMVSTSGSRLLEPAAESALRAELLPLARIVTPNLAEAAVLTGASIAETEADIIRQGRALQRLGCQAVLIKGGHGKGDRAVDLLFDGSDVHRFDAPRIDTRNTHGTGCTLSAAICAGLVKGRSLVDAVGEAKAYLQSAIAGATGERLGSGPGPVRHFSGLNLGALPPFSRT